MPTLINMVLITAGSVTLIHAVRMFIDSSSLIAKKFGISGYTISFLLVAVATSLPETVVGITSALEGNSVLSFGNALGSNVALVTLVISLPILLNSNPGLSTRSILHSKDSYYALFFSILPIALLIDGSLSRIDGGILLTLYVVYSYIVWERSKGLEKFIEHLEEVNMWKQTALFFGSLILLLAASEVIVQSAMNLSTALGLGMAFIGLSVTAIGTSLPEIAFAIGASKGRFQQEILGDVVGSVVANSTVVLGLTSVIRPIVIKNGQVGYTAIGSFIFIMLLFLRFTRTKEKLDKLEAFLLLTLYFVFLGVEYYMQTIGVPPGV